jgi:hypothetical protein
MSTALTSVFRHFNHAEICLDVWVAFRTRADGNALHSGLFSGWRVLPGIAWARLPSWCAVGNGNSKYYRPPCSNDGYPRCIFFMIGLVRSKPRGLPLHSRSCQETPNKQLRLETAVHSAQLR